MCRVIAVGIAVLVGLCGLGLLVLFLTWNHVSEDAFFAADSVGDVLVSFDSQIGLVHPRQRKWERICSGREVAWIDDGKRFVFESDNRLSLFDLTSRTARHLTNPSVIDWYPAWCAASKRVIFARAAEFGPNGFGGGSGRSFDVYTCAVDGSDVRQVTREKFYRVTINAASTVGAELYFVGEPLHKDGRVYRVNLASNSLSEVPGTAGAVTVAVSQDGQSLAMSSSPGFYTISVLNLRSGNRRVLKPCGDGFQDEPAIVADGGIMFFQDPDRSGAYRISKIDPSSGKEIEVFRR